MKYIALFFDKKYSFGKIKFSIKKDRGKIVHHQSTDLVTPIKTTKKEKINKNNRIIP